MPLREEAEQALGFKWADPEVGRRHHLGGEPQEDVLVPACESCGQDMSFPLGGGAAPRAGRRGYQ